MSELKPLRDPEHAATPNEVTTPVGAAGASGTDTGAVEETDHPDDPSANPPFTHTRLSGSWASVVVGLLVLLVLIVFILENGQRVKVTFFGAHAHLPEGVAMLLAAVIGGLCVVFAGTARILQLRARARRSSKSDGRHRRRKKAVATA